MKTSIIAAILLLSTLSPLSAEASVRQKVVLMVSLAQALVPKGLQKFVVHRADRQATDAFNNEFKNVDYDLEVVTDATRTDLYHALHDPSIIALFWLSHAGIVNEMGPLGPVPTARIIDAEVNDVTSAFKEIHPNLRFLGIVGCNSSEVVASMGLSPAEFKQRYPKLFIDSFDHKIEMRKGLQESFARSRKILEAPGVFNGFQSPCPSEEGFPIQVTRTFSESPTQDRLYPAVTIEMGERVIAAFPRHWVNRGDANPVAKTVSTYVPVVDGSNYHVKAVSGAELSFLSPYFSLGGIQIAASDSGWAPFATKSGEPIGKTDRLFL